MPDQNTSFKKKNSRAAALAGLAIAGAGVSHFASPALFEGVTKSAFPRDTRKHVYINGGIETAIGLGFSARKTRQLAIVGLIAIRRLSGRKRGPQPLGASGAPATRTGKPPRLQGIVQLPCTTCRV